MIIEVDRPFFKRLTINAKEIYVFEMFDLTLVLIGYRVEHTEKNKTQAKVVTTWDRFAINEIPEPVLPPDIKQKAFDIATKFITVQTWDEYTMVKQWNREMEEDRIKLWNEHTKKLRENDI